MDERGGMNISDTVFGNISSARYEFIRPADLV